MSRGETLYLLLTVGSFLAFMATLAYFAHQHRTIRGSKPEGQTAPATGHGAVHSGV
jgi:hypothetical protein